MTRKPGLRERKFARTRLKLVDALVQRLQDTRLDEIAVRDLCEDVEISEATFFNYFPCKRDLLSYYEQLWLLELNWQARHSPARGLALVSFSFDWMAQTFERQGGAMAELIVQPREQMKVMDIGLAERMMAFPDKDGMDTLAVGGIDKIWLPALEQAMAQGELPANSHLPTLMMGLATLFYGVPLVLGQRAPGALAHNYRQQLQVFWAGIQAVARG